MRDSRIETVKVKSLESGVRWILKRTFFVDFIKGLMVTLGYNLSKGVTLRYPDEEKWIPYRRFRGVHTLNRDLDGRELCVACELCVKACPTRCITVVPMEDSTGKGISDRVAGVWKVDLVRCLFCGYCEDACPTTAVRLGRGYERACFDLSSAVLDKEKLLLPEEVPPDLDGGVIVAASFERTGAGMKVNADFTKLKGDWLKMQG
ncbi:MAG: NADH-quinone oxidoreductase subunit I [Deltaproteobacteria bacterium]|nr:NADH-quinone oxidoreductase subunit I [Deltaproteobacteria bacterium]